MCKSNCSLKITPTGNMINDIEKYCDAYNIPIENFIEIICDQKVIPMIRGKAAEFSVYNYLKDFLSPHIWKVEKINLNAQPNSPDEDVTVTHIESNIKIYIEVKTAVRTSFSLGARKIKSPHYKVKCHRSRSVLGSPTNDRYLSTDFDIVICNPSNSLLQGGEEFVIINNPKEISFLQNYYNEADILKLFKAACMDWRFATSCDIKENFKGHWVIPRTPYVDYISDKNWKKISNIEQALLQIVKQKSK